MVKLIGDYEKKSCGDFATLCGICGVIGGEWEWCRGGHRCCVC